MGKPAHVNKHMVTALKLFFTVPLLVRPFGQVWEFLATRPQDLASAHCMITICFILLKYITFHLCVFFFT